MNVREFVQTCVNNGIATVTTMEVTRALGCGRGAVFYQLKKMEADGDLWLRKKGRQTYWVIGLSYNGPYKPTTDAEMYEDDTTPCVNDFDMAARMSMHINCIRPTITPAINDQFLDIIEPHEEGYEACSSYYQTTINGLKEDGLIIKYGI